MQPDLLEAAAKRMEAWRRGLSTSRRAADVPHGLVLYEGPSRLDGRPVVAIVTGLLVASKNRKTGDMLQVYILPADVAPTDAVRSGADASVCGDCKHRPALDGVCYVTISWGPQAVWRSWRAGGAYRSATPAQAAGLLAGAAVRFGAWGDPAAVPLDVWTPLLPRLWAWTGYTHQWRSLGPDWRSWLMASVDTPTERAEAKAAGWRTFRAKMPEEGLLDGEIVCLAESRAIPCAKCRGCDGTERGKRLDYAIGYHGVAAGQAWRERQGNLFAIPVAAPRNPW